MIFRSTAAFAVAAISATVLSATALLAVPATAQADSALPFGTPTVKSLGLTGRAGDLLVTAGHVWVSSGNEVDVFTTAGRKVHTVTGLSGAGELLASADGTQVYVALSTDSKIVSLDTISAAQTASWTTGACPTHLALAAGRLFYSYGCDTWGGAVGSLDPADGSAGPVIADRLYSPPLIRAAGNTVVSVVTGIEPSALISYTAGSNGSLTRSQPPRCRCSSRIWRSVPMAPKP